MATNSGQSAEMIILSEESGPRSKEADSDEYVKKA
jgi:hypothetical protein